MIAKIGNSRMLDDMIKHKKIYFSMLPFAGISNLSLQFCYYQDILFVRSIGNT